MKMLRQVRRVMRLPGGCWSSLRAGTVILLYHRIATLETDPFRMAVSPDHFEGHLRIIQQTAPVLSLPQAVGHLSSGTLPRRAIVITFDDGYADNFTHALPLLEKHGVPATVYVATGQIEAQQELWWDELERLLLLPGELPATLQCGSNGTGRTWHLEDDARYGVNQFAKHRSWTVSSREDPTRRHRVFRELWRHLHSLDPCGRSAALKELRAQTGSPSRGRPSHRLMTPEELRRLTRGGLVEAGAHTVNHCSLANLGLAEQRKEILESRTALETIVGRRIVTFSYPFGKTSDFTRETMALVAELGFLAACSNVSGLARRGENVYRLPRFAVADWAPDTFARKLNRWLRS